MVDVLLTWFSSEISVAPCPICIASNASLASLKMYMYKQIQRIVVPRSATTLTLKKVKGQGHGMASLERACHKDHACQISMLYL